jgi:type II secretory pathway predicted ATPase ExeA
MAPSTMISERTLAQAAHAWGAQGIPRTINLMARAAWIQAAKDKSLQISATHLQSALELVPGVRTHPIHDQT